MKRSCRTFALGALLLGVASCSNSASRPDFPDIRFTEEKPLRIDAAAIEVKNDFHPTFREPDVEHLFPVPPEHAVENWVADRLQATGTTRRVVVHIRDASVREAELPKTEGIRGAFTTDQAERYDGTIDVAIDLVDDRGFAEKSLAAKVTRSRSVPEGITPNDRDKAWYGLTKDMMADLDAELERQIRANFTFYVQ